MPVIVAVARMEGGKLFPRQIPDISTRLSTTQPLLVPPSYLTLTDPMMATQMEVKLGDLKQSPKFQALRSARMVDYVVGKQGSNERSYKLSADAWQEAEDWAIQRNLLGQTDMRVLWPDKALQIANEAWKAAELAKKTNGIVDIWKKDREEFEGWDVDGFMGQVWPGKRKRSSRPGAHTGYESGQVWKVEVTRAPVLYSAAMGDMTTFGNERSLIATPNNFLNREFDGAEAGQAGSHVGPLDPKEEGSEYRTEKIADVQADAEIVKLSEGEDMYGAAASRTDIFADENDDVTRDEHEVGDADPPSNPTSAAIGEDVDQLTARTGQLRTDTDEYSEEDEVEGVVEGEPGVSQEASVRDESLHTTATSTEATGVEEPGVGLPDDIESLTVNELSGAEEHDVEQPGKNAPSVGHDESATEESDKIVSDKQAGRFILHVGDFSWSLEEELFAKESAYFEALLRGSFKVRSPASPTKYH